MNKKNIGAIYPLSSMQEGLLFHSLYSPGSGTYVQQLHCRIVGGVNVAAFKRAWQAVMDRHSILRTSFLWEGLKEPLQVVQERIGIPWKEEDWRHLTVSQQSAGLEDMLQKDREEGYEFHRAPLFRLALLQTGEDRYYFVWSYHHILLDGWCRQLLITEVFTCYEAYSLGREVKFKRPRPYRDYIAWLKRQDIGTAEAFWREELRGFTNPTVLLGNHAPRSTQEGRDGEQSIRLDRRSTNELNALAKHLQITVNTILQGAWALVLSRYSGQMDVIFGAVVSGRSAPLQGIESMVGLFINTLPVRVRVSDRQTVRSFLKGLQAGQTKALDYEYSPLVQVQAWSDLPSGTPLFESLFVFENYPLDWAIRNWAGALLRISEVGNFEKVNYPLMLNASPGAELLLSVVFDRGRFDSIGVIRLLERLLLVLKAMVSNGEQQIGDISLLTAAERHQVMIEWNDTDAEYPNAECFPQIFERQADSTPDALAVSFREHWLTYGELNRRANAFAESLFNHGVAPEIAVSVITERGVDLLICILAVFKTGGVYVPVDPLYPPDRLRHVLDLSESRVILTGSESSHKLRSILAETASVDGPVILESGELLTETREGPTFRSRRDQNSLAYLIFTSGSTGTPKGAMVEHRGMLNHLYAKIGTLSLTKADAIAETASQSFDISIWQFLAALLVGGRVHIIDDDGVRDPATLITEVSENRVTVLEVVPSMLRPMLEEAQSAPARHQGLSGLRMLVVTGEALPPALCRVWLSEYPEVPVVNAYGPTECSDDVTQEEVTREPDQQDSSVPIGRALNNTRTYVTDGSGRLSPIGVAGELYVGGDCDGRGYSNERSQTAMSFVPDPHGRESGARLYRTGDLVRHRPDGKIEFLGRIDYQVKIRGYRIELGEVGEALASHPGIRESVVVADEDPRGGQILVAYFVAKDQPGPGLSQLQSYLREKLPEYMTPSAFVELPQMPLTSNGKLDRKRLPAPTTAAAGEREELRTPIDEIIAGIWAEVLRLKQVGLHDNFFELGGHSLLATQVISRVREALRVEMPIRLFFERPTIAGLAEAVQRGAGLQLQPPPIMPVTRDAALPLSYAQRRLWLIQQLEPDSAAYNVPSALRLEGPLDLASLKQSFTEIVARHEVLRTRFAARDGRPLQIIDEATEINMPLWDLSEIEQGEREEMAREFERREAALSFDLVRGPLMRVKLLRLARDKHVLLITMHHIVCDGWSTDVMIRELAILHQAYREGGRPALSELPVQYADFAVWQRELLQ